MRFVTHKTIFAARATLQTSLRRVSLRKQRSATPDAHLATVPDNKGLYTRQQSTGFCQRSSTKIENRVSDRETSLRRFEIIASRNIGERRGTNIEGKEREVGLDTSKRVHPDLELGASPNTPLGTPSDSKRELFEW